MDKRSNYDLLVEKVLCIKKKYEGTYIPDVICSYLFYDFKGIINERRLKSICGDPMYFPVAFMNSLVKNAKIVNDRRGRYMFNATTLYQYYETIWEDGDDYCITLSEVDDNEFENDSRLMELDNHYAIVESREEYRSMERDEVQEWYEDGAKEAGFLG